MLDPAEFGIGLKKQEQLERREQSLVLSLLRYMSLLAFKGRLYEEVGLGEGKKTLTLESFAAVFDNFPLNLMVANNGKSVISSKGGRKIRLIPLLDRGEFKFDEELKKAYFGDREKDPCLLLFHEHVKGHYLAITLNKYVGPKSNSLQFYSKYAGATFAVQTLPVLCDYLKTIFVPRSA